MRECQALLLDMDGTLIDSDPLSEAIWRDWAAEKGADIEHILRIHHGRRPQETIDIVAPHLDGDAEAARIQAENADAVEGIRVYPGVAELLARLPKTRYAIVTSAVRAVAVNRLGAMGLWDDPVLISADVVDRGKPHAEPYLKGAAALGFRPEDCVAVEDAPAGLASARAAGMFTVAVRTTQPAERLEADWYIEHLGRLEVAIEDVGLRLAAPEAVATR